MKGFLITLILSVLFCNHAFAQHKQEILFPPPVLEIPNTPFCDLVKSKNELVYTRGVYSYTNKKWSLHAENGMCGNLTANMFLTDDIFLSPKFQKALKAVNQNPKLKYLVVDIIGFFQDDLSDYEHGAGDMGENKYRFIVKKVIDVMVRLK